MELMKRMVMVAMYRMSCIKLAVVLLACFSVPQAGTKLFQYFQLYLPEKSVIDNLHD